MRFVLFFLFSFFISNLFAQDIPVLRTKSTQYIINQNSLIYDKETSKRIFFKDLNELIKKFPNATLIPKEEDNKGNPLSFYFVKDDTNVDLIENSKIVEINRKDIFDNTFNLLEINSKFTLVILQLDLEFPMINVEAIKEAENAAIKRGYTSIILTSTKSKTSKEFTELEGLKSIIIPNALSIIQKYETKRFPKYLILDHNKSIVLSLKYSYEVEDELKELD